MECGGCGERVGRKVSGVENENKVRNGPETDVVIPLSSGSGIHSGCQGNGVPWSRVCPTQLYDFVLGRVLATQGDCVHDHRKPGGAFNFARFPSIAVAPLLRRG